MSLLNRLRPKWQNSDPEVRAEAVRQLDKDEVELLLAVAQQDDDPRVRRIAVKKIDAPRSLLEIAETDEDSGLRDFARSRARQLLVQIACDDRDLEESRRALALLGEVPDIVSVADRAHFPEVRDAAFSTLQGDEALAAFVRRSKDPERRAEALELIGTPAALKSIVVDESSSDLAALALGRIDDAATLESILELHTVSKALRRQAFSKLWDMVPDDHPVKSKARRERFEEVCRRAEALAERAALVPAEELEELRAAWSAAEAEVEGGPDLDLQERFERASRELLALVKRTRPSQEPVEDDKEETSPPQTSSDKGHAPPSESASAAVHALMDRIRNLDEGELASGLAEARSERDALEDLDPDSAERLETVLRDAEARLTSLRHRRETKERLQYLLAQAEESIDTMDIAEAERDWRVIDQHYRSVADSVAGDIEERYRHLVEKLNRRRDARAREETANQEELDRRIAALDALAAQDPVSIKDAIRELREAQDFLRTMGPLPRETNRKKARRRLADAREALYRRTQDTRELEDWKRWANADIQEGLIQRIEKLRDSNDMPKVAKELRNLHEEWKRAGAAPAEKADELWQRYKAVRDELKPRCDAFFEKQKQERAENLVKKEALCVEVEALADSEQWNAAAEKIKSLQAEWRKMGPVPKETSDAIWKRFRSACDRFFQRRKEHFGELKEEREQNLAKKVALCERAEAIKDSTDWSTTASELKRLQSDWRTIGPVPRKKSDQIWARFRGACDHFFDRFKRRHEIESEERAKERLAVVEELAALPGDLSPDTLGQRTLEIWNAWKKLGDRVETAPELVERFEVEMGEVLSKAPEAFRGGELDPKASKKRRAKLAERMEGIVSELEGIAPGGDSLEDLASRLKDALARNTMAGGKGRDRRPDWRGARDEVHRLRANWLRSAPVSSADREEVATRFEQAYQRFLALKPEPRSQDERRPRS